MSKVVVLDACALVALLKNEIGADEVASVYQQAAQGEIQIGTLGKTTAQAVKDAGLRLDLEAPTKEFPSMTMALDHFLKEHNKKMKK